MNLAGRFGVALAAGMAVYMMYNAIQAWTDPQAFAMRLGLSAAAAEAEDWVRIYALRAAFIALLLAGLTLARLWRALFLLSVAALVMPLGDAWLTYSAGAPAGTFGRHLAVAAVVALSAILLNQADQTGRT
jgi:predicted small integral membrane protein